MHTILEKIIKYKGCRCVKPIRRTFLNVAQSFIIEVTRKLKQTFWLVEQTKSPDLTAAVSYGFNVNEDIQDREDSILCH